MNVPISSIYNSQKVETMFPSTDGWTKLRCIHTMNFIWQLKERKILIHTTTWMNLENKMLSEKKYTKC